METVDVKLPSKLLRAADLEESSLSQEAARLLALELYREDKVSLGRAAELCQTPMAAFMDFAANTVFPRYGAALFERCVVFLHHIQGFAEFPAYF
jgi:hypothetical protein